MRHIVRYRIYTMPKKLVVDVRVTFDDRKVEYNSNFSDGTATNVAIYPWVEIKLTDPETINENGKIIKGKWSKSAAISLTKFAFPLFVRDLKCILNDMKEYKDLYQYVGDRLELNHEVVNKCIKKSILMNTHVEFSPVVLLTDDNQYIEGIKFKITNEQNMITMTLNEAESFAYALDHLELDNLAILIYKNFSTRSVRNQNDEPTTPVEIVKPKLNKYDFDQIKNEIDTLNVN